VKRFTRILGVASVTVLLSTGVAAAASLGMSSGQLSAGSAAVAGCSSSALTATRNVNNSGTVTQVNVLNVPQACAGETLSVTLENSSHTSIGSSSTTIGACTGGCTVTLSGFGAVPAVNLAAYALSLAQ
jgi:hypothetical protein